MYKRSLRKSYYYLQDSALFETIKSHEVRFDLSLPEPQYRSSHCPYHSKPESARSLSRSRAYFHMKDLSKFPSTKF